MSFKHTIKNIIFAALMTRRLLPILVDKSANETIVTLHANYIKGNSNKANKMKEYGFWLKKGEIQTNRLSQGLTPIHENTCIPYVPSHLQVNEKESLKASSS